MSFDDTSRQRALVLFPGALGDFLCALPAIQALASRHVGGVRLVAKPQWLELLDDPRLDRISIDRREVSELYATTAPLSRAARALFSGFETAYSWTGHGNPDFAARLKTDNRATHIFPFRGMNDGEHAVDYYARCVGVALAKVPASIFAPGTGKIQSLLESKSLVGRDWLLLHPGSGATRKNWQGFDALAAVWRTAGHGAVVVLAGPVEQERRTPLPTADVVIENLALPDVRALLSAAPLYVGNDTGISHLAALMDTPGVVLFGPSDPTVWAPRSARIEVLYRPTPCPTCGPQRFCGHRLTVDDVLTALHRRRCG